MKALPYLRLFLISLGSAVLFCAISLAIFVQLLRIADLAESHNREELLLLLADSVERSIQHIPTADLQTEVSASKLRQELRAQRRELLPHNQNSESHGRPFRPPIGPRSEFWLLNERGDVVFSNRDTAIENPWSKLSKPSEPHSLSASQDLFQLRPALFAVKLKREPALYLVVRTHGRSLTGPLFLTQASLTFGTVLIALFLSLSITFLYLRRKSTEARAVFLRLEQGDLKARFAIKRFDEFGGLMVDFNRMAGEIERLVNQVQATELSRKQLLQELGHDLRTPLTSLKTSFENLKHHAEKMSPEQRVDTLEMMDAEIEYFSDLLEKLMTIASIDNPRYKTNTKAVDLCALLQQEITSRLANSPKINWTLKGDTAGTILGDSHLLYRLFKNALDNAARFAKSTVTVVIARESDSLSVHILDDGPGLDPSALASFGRRRTNRQRRAGKRLNFSLGLGSVIMKSITELHGGSLKIKNRDDASSGAELVISLPRACT